jgi:NAD(P)-dependent dehydrogenase (short-subunit alcohol dehydrogenase family)
MYVGHRAITRILKLVADFSKHTSTLDVLVSNAGFLRKEPVPWKESLTASQMSEHFLSSTVEDWTETFNVNTTALWHLSGALLPHLKASQKGGNIILITSINGVHWSASSCTSS